MSKICTLMMVVVLMVSLVSGVAGAGAPEVGAGRSLAQVPIPKDGSTAIARIKAATYITVTSTTDDYNDGYSKTCLNATPCTLRRAVNQAYGVGSGDRPVHIIFQIPITDTGYNADLEVWKITLTGTTMHDLRQLMGQTIIDGSTQPDGRATGPKIIVNGDGRKNYGLTLWNTGNVIRGLAMQDFQEAHISLAGSSNTIEDCWFGLSDDGTNLSSGDFTEPEGGGGIAMAGGVTGNIVRNNVLAGFFQVAISVRGSANVVSGNWVGARADGTVALPGGFTRHPCAVGAWEGGVGFTVEGAGNQIGGPTPAEGNRLVGLYTSTTMQSPAMDIIGADHVIQNNVIGIDANDDLIGVCGIGLDLGGGPDDMQVLGNTIVEPSVAIFMNSSVTGNTLRSNLIWWAASGPADGAISYGATIPGALAGFVPARVTSVDGTTVTGTSGEGSACANCTVELFLDDADGVVEALQSLAVVTASADGSWTANLSAPLAHGYGLRTMSTVPDNFTIPGLTAGTTSRLSGLYATFKIFLPLVSR